MDEYFIEWHMFDVKAKYHWWRGECDGHVFFIEKCPQNFYSVTQQSVDRIVGPWEVHNTLKEAKEWADNYYLEEIYYNEQVALLTRQGACA